MGYINIKTVFGQKCELSKINFAVLLFWSVNKSVTCESRYYESKMSRFTLPFEFWVGIDLFFNIIV